MFIAPFITSIGAHELSNTPFRKKLGKGLVSLIPAPFKPWEANSMKDYITDVEHWGAGQAMDEALGPEFAGVRLAGEALGMGPYKSAIQGHPDMVPTTVSGGQYDEFKDMTEDEMRRSFGMLPPLDETKDTSEPSETKEPEEPEQDFPRIDEGRRETATM